MVALLDLDDFADDDFEGFDTETEVAHICAKLQMRAHLHGRSIEAEADLWALMDDDERDTYAAQLETVPLGKAGFRGLN